MKNFVFDFENCYGEVDHIHFVKLSDEQAQLLLYFQKNELLIDEFDYKEITDADFKLINSL